MFFKNEELSMSSGKKPAFLYHFDELEDQRIERNKLYPLAEILLIVMKNGAKLINVAWYFFKSFLNYVKHSLLAR